MLRQRAAATRGPVGIDRLEFEGAMCQWCTEHRRRRGAVATKLKKAMIAQPQLHTRLMARRERKRQGHWAKRASGWALWKSYKYDWIYKQCKDQSAATLLPKPCKRKVRSTAYKYRRMGALKLLGVTKWELIAQWVHEWLDDPRLRNKRNRMATTKKALQNAKDRKQQQKTVAEIQPHQTLWNAGCAKGLCSLSSLRAAILKYRKKVSVGSTWDQGGGSEQPPGFTSTADHMSKYLPLDAMSNDDAPKRQSLPPKTFVPQVLADSLWPLQEGSSGCVRACAAHHIQHEHALFLHAQMGNSIVGVSALL